jgi:hypothetical protein
VPGGRAAWCAAGFGPPEAQNGSELDSHHRGDGAGDARNPNRTLTAMCAGHSRISNIEQGMMNAKGQSKIDRPARQGKGAFFPSLFKISCSIFIIQ